MSRPRIAFVTGDPNGRLAVVEFANAAEQKLDMWLDVNGQRRQTGNTSTMIFSMAKCISYVSQFMTLLPGDIVTTGTPPGVGLGMKPEPKFLKAGDVVTLGMSFVWLGIAVILVPHDAPGVAASTGVCAGSSSCVTRPGKRVCQSLHSKKWHALKSPATASGQVQD